MILLWWIGEQAPDRLALEAVRARVEHALGPPVVLYDAADRPRGGYDPVRRQQLSGHVLRWLRGARPPGATRVCAVTDQDLFIPVLTFVYGEAELEGAGAVVSTARLAGRDGSPVAGPGLVESRLAKECVHELGHTFGLLHCDDPRCAMARSRSLLDVDAKGYVLCHECRQQYWVSRRKSEVGHGSEGHAHPGGR